MKMIDKRLPTISIDKKVVESATCRRFCPVLVINVFFSSISSIFPVVTCRPCRAPWSYPVLRRAGTEHPLGWPGQQSPGLQATALHTPPSDW
jgi:hypothetical protein